MGLTAQDQQSRAEFEAKFGPMPWGCTWTGQGYCPTEFNAWDAQKYANKFEGWQAARALPAGMEPAAWTLTATLDKRETTTTAHLWFSDPVNCMWTGLFTAAQVLAMGRVPAGWTDDQMIRFAWMCINPGLRGDSISNRLEVFREHEALRGIAAPRPPAAQERRPLTDEEIGHVIMAYEVCVAGDIYALVKAIEAAHGITHSTGD